jgi:hypothetical protein
MATEHASVPAPINGTYAATQSHPYTSHEQANPASATSTSPTSTQPAAGAQDIPKEEVAWYFVEQYYTTLSRTPDKLYVSLGIKSLHYDH